MASHLKAFWDIITYFHYDSRKELTELMIALMNSISTSQNTKNIGISGFTTYFEDRIAESSISSRKLDLVHEIWMDITNQIGNK